MPTLRLRRRCRKIAFYCLLLASFFFALCSIALSVQENREKTDLSQKVQLAFESGRKVIEAIRSRSGVVSVSSYDVVYNAVEVDNKLSTFDVTLLTHASLGQLGYFHEILERWKGPLILSVFLSPGEVIQGLAYLSSLVSCSDIPSEHFSAHLIIPSSGLGANFPDGDTLLDMKSLIVERCNSFAGLSSHVPNVTSAYSTRVPYPGNVLRNVALQTVTTDFVLALDVDILPSDMLRERFLNMAKEIKQSVFADLLQKTLYVLPAYEARSNFSQLKNKQDLIESVRNEDARPFYSQVCWKCQQRTDYDRWESLGDYSDDLQVAYSVAWRDAWEPYYVAARAAVVGYHQGFLQYGFNRLSQVCEMHLAGHIFSILDQAFVVHRGFKEPGGFHDSKTEEHSRNKLLYEQLKVKWAEKYNTVRRC